MDIMEAKVEVKMTTGAMYEFLLYHTYHSLNGILSILFGIGAFALYFATRETAQPYQRTIYLVFGLIFLIYMPVSLYFRAVKQVQLNPVFKHPLTYTVNEAGLTTTQGEQTGAVEWNALVKAVETRKSILLYTTKRYSYVLPKACMGGNESSVRQLIKEKMPAGKVKIK